MSCVHLDEGAESCLCTECAAMVTVVLAAYEADRRKLLAWAKEAKAKLLAGGQVSLRRFCSYCASDDFATEEEQRAHAAACDKHPAVARAAVAEGQAVQFGLRLEDALAERDRYREALRCVEENLRLWKPGAQASRQAIETIVAALAGGG